MTKAEKIAFAILKPISSALIVVLGAYTIVWGLWVLSPFWDVFSHATLYSAMASVAGETFWGGLATLSGVGILYGVYRHSYLSLRFGTFIGVLHWLIIAAFYFIGDWGSTGGITSLTFAVFSALVWVNVKVNNKKYAKHRAE